MTNENTPPATSGVLKAKRTENGRFYVKVEDTANNEVVWDEVGENWYNLAAVDVPEETQESQTGRTARFTDSVVMPVETLSEPQKRAKETRK